ncbi:MAG: DUF1161 domain-containing protein [Gammaproteobacteria bacterium]
MKHAVSAAAVLALSVVAAPALAAGTPCDEVVAKIAEKLDAKGVVGYTLTPTPKDDVKPEYRVVGVCEAGTKRIVYVRGGSAPAAQPATEPAAQ